MMRGALLALAAAAAAAGGPPRDATCAAVRGYAGPRIVVVGDVHGDADALREVLAAAGLSPRGPGACAWSGGNATLVQIGDVVDRGPASAAALACLRRLAEAAPRAGGAVVRLVGNHELMWAGGNFRYAHANDRGAAGAAVREWRADVLAGRVVGAASLGPYLFVHAGLRPELLAFYRRGGEATATAADLAALVARRVADAVRDCGASEACAFSGPLFRAGADRGGTGVGGAFWTDWAALRAARLPAAVVQVVGHTVADCDARADGACEPIRARADLAAVVVDAGLSRAYHSNRAYLDARPGGALVARWLATGGAWRSRDLARACRPTPAP